MPSGKSEGVRNVDKTLFPWRELLEKRQLF